MVDLKILYKLIKSRLQKKPIAISFDVTNKCNLKCPGCYWQNLPSKPELSPEKIKMLFKKLRKQGTIFCIYLGGEPLLRPEIIKLCSRYIPINWTVTNGTIEPIEIKNLLYGVSIDGTKKIHDKIRGNGVYQKAYNNFFNNKKSFTFTTLNSINKDEPEKILKEWSNTSIRGMYFNFATPFKNIKNKYWLDWPERDKITDNLLKMKKEYGDFILLTKEQIEMFKSENNKKKVERCKKKHSKNLTASFYSDGTRKDPCTLGKFADCNKCGSACSTLPNSIFDINQDWRNIYSKLFDMK